MSGAQKGLEKTPMKIVVLQRHDFNLDSIRDAVADINPQLAEEIVFTENPSAALDYVSDVKEPVLVVSGQIFNHRTSGTRLAQAMKYSNPGVIFFLFTLASVTGVGIGAVDGFIPESSGGPKSGIGYLAKILTSNLEGATAASIKAAFPQIS